MKLASEKSFNRGICPVMNVKGKTVSYPFVVKNKTFTFRSDYGILGPKQMMIMDIIGTKLIHNVFENENFSGRIPIPKDKMVKELSGKYMSYKLLKYVTTHISPMYEGKIPEGWYSSEGKLCDIDKENPRIKNATCVVLNDGQLRKELPFLKKYSSKQIQDMIIKTSESVLQMNFPIQFYDGKKYQTFPFNNYGMPSRLFTMLAIEETKIAKDRHVLEREYLIQFDTILGYMFMQNMASCYRELLPGRFYDLSDYAQLYYRLFILTYYKNPKTGKTPKIPISLDEIRKRLDLKTPDTSMVRRVVNRILAELSDQKFISQLKEEKIHGKYMYSYVKSSWKEISSDDVEEDNSESDLDNIDN